MLEKIKERIFPLLIALSALSISASAAFYSVTGLSMLFSGARLAVIIMASSLEISKLVIASLLYQYWSSLNKILKVYLSLAVFILVIITSAGIYGFLSNSYQTVADQNSIVETKINSLITKKDLFEENRNSILKEKELVSSIQKNLSQSSITQYTDRNGNLTIRTNNAAIRNIESASTTNEILSNKLEIINDSIFSIENQILEIKTLAISESELGPLKFLSSLMGVPFEKIINIYILVIIFVFDPLAISLVLAANFAFARLKKPKNTNIVKEPTNDIEQISTPTEETIEQENETDDDVKSLIEMIEDREMERIKAYEKYLQEKKQRKQESDIKTYN
jgi:hypothetical protein